MKLEVLRYWSKAESTLSILFDATDGRVPLCYALEDEFRTKKVWGETRIPAGTYKIKLRTEGGHHERYSKKFAAIHKGMLWIQDVPGFEYILIHIGNTDDDTAGCLLVGTSPATVDEREDKIAQSTAAYKKVYVHVLEALEGGEDVEIEYIDYDTPPQLEAA